MSHDYSVFTHAVNVATNCLLLARQLGINDRQELLQIGQGALLHDIGVQGVPRHIMEKPGKLTDRERRIMQEHPILGFKELRRREDLTWGQLMMVYSHHERCDGRGYPVGLVQSEIHEYARLCAIADVYEAICRDRPYRRASRRRDALEYLDRQAGRGFDEEMMRCWMSVVAKAEIARWIYSLPCHVQLPQKLRDDLEKTGAGPVPGDDVRRHRRMYCRGEKHRAALGLTQSLPALPRETAWHGVYTNDFSKQGCGFLHSAVLYPGERLRLVLLTGVERTIEVAWCRRLDKNCYAVGATIHRDRCDCRRGGVRACLRDRRTPTLL